MPDLRHSPGCLVADLERSAPPNSEALASYLRRVYGSAPAQQLQAWRWHLKDVVHFDYLPPHVQALCTAPLGNAPAGLLALNRSLLATHAFYALSTTFAGWSRDFGITRMLWHFHHTRACPREGARTHHGGDLSLSKDEHNGWIEVAHVAAHKRELLTGFNLREFLWMNRAHGSGLWYRQGRTRRHADFCDSPQCTTRFNETRGSDGYLLRMGQTGFDTVVFERRVGDETLCRQGSGAEFYN